MSLLRGAIQETGPKDELSGSSSSNVNESESMASKTPLLKVNGWLQHINDIGMVESVGVLLPLVPEVQRFNMASPPYVVVAVVVPTKPQG